VQITINKRWRKNTIPVWVNKLLNTSHHNEHLVGYSNLCKMMRSLTITLLPLCGYSRVPREGIFLSRSRFGEVYGKVVTHL